jgi:hypothetical protein
MFLLTWYFSKVPFIGLGIGRKRQRNLMSILGDQEKAMNGQSISVYTLEIWQDSLCITYWLLMREGVGKILLTIPPVRIPPAL